jgi:tetratricopeptide (TPR) repeat protein
MEAARHYLLLLLALTLNFCIALVLERRLVQQSGEGREKTMLERIMGESRALFANHFMAIADAYLLSGYYPSIFDQANMAKSRSAPGGSSTALIPARDPLEKFGRYFRPNEIRIVGNEDAQETLPWIYIASRLNPREESIYTLGGYWLRTRLKRYEEARQFIREGLRENPRSYRLLFELGRTYFDEDKNSDGVRNIWTRSLGLWEEQEGTKQEPALEDHQLIVGHLARLEERTGNSDAAIRYLERMKTFAQDKSSIEAQIAALRSGNRNP